MKREGGGFSHYPLLAFIFVGLVPALQVAAGDADMDLLHSDAARNVDARPAAGGAEAPGAEQAGFAVRLETFSSNDVRLETPVPSEFQDYAVFSAQSVLEGKTQYQILLGHFATAKAAEQARQRLLQRFPRAEVVSVNKRREERLPPATPSPTDADVGSRAAELMASGRRALDAGDGRAATAYFKELLTLPPNRFTPEARDLVAAGRQRNEDPPKVPTAPEQRLAQKSAAGPPADETYVDQLIEGLEPRPEDVGAGPISPEPEGRRYLNVDFIGYNRKLSPGRDSTEIGAAIRGRRETLNYGELVLDAEVSNFSGASVGLGSNDRGVGGTAFFGQNRLPITGSTLMNAGLGVFTGVANPLVSNSYRLTLPTTLLGGAAVSLYDANSELRVAAGKIGRLDGIALRQFEETDGELYGLGYTRRLGPLWSASAQLWNVQGASTAPNHQSLAWAAQYLKPDLSQSFQLHGLNDSKGNLGLWADGELQATAWRHYFGAFYLEPELLWTDVQVASDRQGGYWRSELRTALDNLTLGFDVTNTNVRDDDSRPGSLGTFLFASGSRRFSRTTYVGGSASYSYVDPRNSVANTRHLDALNATAYVSHLLPVGWAQFQASHADSEGPNATFRENGLTWNQGWLQREQIGVSTSAGYFHGLRDGDDFDRYLLAVIAGGAFGPGFRGDASVNYTEERYDSGRDLDALSASLSLNWLFDRDWSLGVQAIWNRTKDRFLGSDFVLQDNSIQVTLRYENWSGISHLAVGSAGDGYGYGSLVGTIFFDENRDGIRQAGERGAAGVTVLVDGQFPVVSDQAGNFSVQAVPSGPHNITLQLGKVPLPWGVESEAPRRVEIPVRGEVRLDFPLVRLGP